MHVPTLVTWQYCRAGIDITDQFHAAQDADEVRAWDDDICVLALERCPDQPNEWRLTGCDRPVPVEAYDRRFVDPDDAADYLRDVLDAPYAFPTYDPQSHPTAP